MYRPKKKQKDRSFPSSPFLTHKVRKCGLKLTTILVLPLNLCPAALYPFLCTTFPGSRFRISHFLPSGGWQVRTRPLNTLHSVCFALVWHILSKGQFNRGKDNNKLLIGTLKTGDHDCLTEVTAKYRSAFTLIKGSYFQGFGDRL